MQHGECGRLHISCGTLAGVGGGIPLREPPMNNRSPADGQVALVKMKPQLG
jgi:hypothetical protein